LTKMLKSLLQWPVFQRWVHGNVVVVSPRRTAGNAP